MALANDNWWGYTSCLLFKLQVIAEDCNASDAMTMAMARRNTRNPEGTKAKSSLMHQASDRVQAIITVPQLFSGRRKLIDSIIYGPKRRPKAIPEFQPARCNSGISFAVCQARDKRGSIMSHA